MPVIYARFGYQFGAITESGMLPVQMARFGGGDIFSLPGAIALGLIHPIAIILTSVFSVGFSATAIAGERQRGTLEVALARPIARRTFCLTLLGAAFGFVGLTVGALLTGTVMGAMCAGVISEFPVRNVPLLWLNAVLLFGAFTAVGLAASHRSSVWRRRSGSRSASSADVLPGNPEIAVAGSRGAAAVFAIPLPQGQGHPARHRRPIGCGITRHREHRGRRLGIDGVSAARPCGSKLIDLCLQSTRTALRHRPIERDTDTVRRFTGPELLAGDGV